MMELPDYAKLNNKSYQTALDECRAIGALSFEGSKILINDDVVNKHLENEIIDSLKNIKSLEV